jgi:Secretion system C-terminal sorting domain
MKKIITILIMLFALVISAQTQIQMPAGYGRNDVNGFVPGAAEPFYSYNGYLYCKAHLQSNITGFSGAIFKVNEATNVATQITGPIISYDSIQLSNFQIYNDEIFCTLNNEVVRINPNSNTFSKTSSIGFEFAVLNNKIFGAGGIYDLISNTYSVFMNPENPAEVLQGLEGFDLYNNAIYCTRTIFNGPSINQYESKIYKILDANSIQLLYTNPSNGYYQGFDNSKPVTFNNKLCYRFRNVTTQTNSVLSYNLDNNSISTIFTYEPIDLMNSHYVYNNNIYFNNSLDQTLVSNGISPAVLTNIPNIISQGGGNFVFNTDSPLFGSGGKNASILYNNKMFGLKTRYDANIPANVQEIRKTDGTLAGTSIIYSSNDQLYSAIVVNNKLYFFRFTAVGGFGELREYNDQSQQLTLVSLFGLKSYLYGVNNSIYFYGSVNGNNGLYKLNTNTLSNKKNPQSQTFSISPNPTNSTLNIQTQQKINTINIIDLIGRKTSITNFENNKIDVSNLQNGVYFLEIATENGLQTQKFIKN